MNREWRKIKDFKEIIFEGILNVSRDAGDKCGAAYRCHE